MFTLIMTIVNTAFWLGLHFGVAFLYTCLPERIQRRIFDHNKRFFHVSEKQMRFYRKIRLPAWKDKLPQWRRYFDKSRLKSLDKAYVSAFITETCKAEIIHLTIAAAGYASVLFALLCDDPPANVPLFLVIATIIALLNIPFCLIQRYNRNRLERLYNVLLQGKAG